MATPLLLMVFDLLYRIFPVRRLTFVAVVVLGLVLVGCGGRGVGTRFGAPADERCEFDDMVGGQVEPGAQELVVPPKKKAWEATFGGEEAARPHVRARLAGWPERLARRPAHPATRPIASS